MPEVVVCCACASQSGAIRVGGVMEGPILGNIPFAGCCSEHCGHFRS